VGCWRPSAFNDVARSLARHPALQALSIEQLLHMIHSMLAAILAALLWTSVGS
jgi:hypothetical protein